MAMTPEQLDTFIKAKIEEHVGELIGNMMETLSAQISSQNQQIVNFIAEKERNGVFFEQMEAMWKGMVEQEYKRLFPVPVKKVANDE